MKIAHIIFVHFVMKTSILAKKMKILQALIFEINSNISVTLLNNWRKFGINLSYAVANVNDYKYFSVKFIYPRALAFIEAHRIGLRF